MCVELDAIPMPRLSNILYFCLSRLCLHLYTSYYYFFAWYITAIHFRMVHKIRGLDTNHSIGSILSGIVMSQYYTQKDPFYKSIKI